MVSCEEVLGFSLISAVDQLTVDHELELGEASYKPIYLVRGVFVNFDDAALPEFFDTRWVSEAEFFASAILDDDGVPSDGTVSRPTPEMFDGLVKRAEQLHEAFRERLNARASSARERLVAGWTAHPAQGGTGRGGKGRGGGGKGKGGNAAAGKGTGRGGAADTR